MIEVLIADDHPFFIAGVRDLLAGLSELTVVGHVGSGPEALAFIQARNPHVAVLDVSMPQMTGIEVARHLKAAGSMTQVVILTLFEDEQHVRQAFQAGCRGYVLKRSTAENLRLAILAVHGGGLYIDPSVAGAMLASIEPPSHVSTGSKVAPLTVRERDVLRAVALGFTIKEVAAQLGITSKSVETYKARAAEKLGLGSRAKIVRYAMEQGWFDKAAG